MHPRSSVIRFTIAALLVGALPGLAFAQQRRQIRGPDLEATMAELTEELKLDENQAAQIRELLSVQNEQSRKMLEEARSSGQGRSGFSAMRERMRELREGTDANIKALLSEEQSSRYEEILAERSERRRSRRGPGRPPGGQGGP